MDFLKIFLRGITLLPSTIQNVEELFGAQNSAQGSAQNGAQKKKAVVDLVGTAIDIADAVTKKQVADAGKFKEGLSMVIDGVVACLNASIWAKQ